MTRDLLQLAVWFGLVTGLVEGSGLLLFQHLKWLNWDISMTPVSIEIAWISPIFDAVLFGAVGFVLAAGSRLWPRLPVTRLAAFCLSFMLFFDWFALTGRIRHYAVVILAAGLATVVARWFHAHESMAYRVCRKTLPWALTVVVLVFAAIQGGLWFKERRDLTRLQAARPDAPSVLTIVVDTLRADHVSAYGYPRSTTPNLDRIAREGVVFDNAISASSWTLPSHASLMTGRYPHEHGAERDGLDGRFPTIGEALREHGYATGGFSANTIYVTRMEGLNRGFVHFEDFFTSIADMAARTIYGRQFEWFVLRRFFRFEDYVARKRAADINRSVLHWVDRTPDRPAFLFVNYFDLHDPYLPPQPYRSQFARVPNPGGIINSFLFRLRPKMTTEQLQSELDAYDGALAYVDHAIGDLLAQLQQRRPNWLVVITSDHGESFGEHGLFTHKNALYTEDIRVPLILWWPGHVPAGVRVAQPVANTSLPATLLEMLGTPESGRFPTPSIVPLWEGRVDQSTWPLPLSEIAKMPYATLKEFNIPAYYGAMRSLIGPDDHYIVNDALGAELYQWRQDVLEQHNLIGRPNSKDLVATFQLLLRQAVAAGIR